MNFLNFFAGKKTISVFIITILPACVSEQVNYDTNRNITVTNAETRLAEKFFPTPSALKPDISSSQSVQMLISPPSITGIPLSIKLDTEKLPNEFRGESVILPEIFNHFFQVSKKDEYESKTDYINRLKKEQNDYIYAFVIEKSNMVEYDADDQILSVDVGISMFNSNFTARTNTKEYKEVTISSKYIDLNYYIGKNAFGREVLVKKGKSYNYGVAIANQIKKEESLRKKVTVKIIPKDAKTIGKEVGIVLICKLHIPNDLEPLAYEYYHHLEPMIYYPRDIRSADHFIVVDLYQIWIYEKKTGQILKKEIVNL